MRSATRGENEERLASFKTLATDKLRETTRTRRKYPLPRHLLFQPNLTHFCFTGMNHPSKDVDRDIFFSAGNINILFKLNILCKVEFYGRASGPFAPWEATQGHATDLSIAYRRKSFRKMTSRFLVPTHIKLTIAWWNTVVSPHTFVIDQSHGPYCGPDFKLCLLYSLTGNGKAAWFSQETLDCVVKIYKRTAEITGRKSNYLIHKLSLWSVVLSKYYRPEVQDHRKLKI